MKNAFELQLEGLEREHDSLISKINHPLQHSNGLITRYAHPVLTAAHTPVFWRYDLNPASNPYLMERFGINSVFNAGAVKFNNKYLLMARVEGVDRKSFFAVAESDSGIEGFCFRDYPVQLPDIDLSETNVYDMRIVLHDDGWYYGTFCSEQKDQAASEADQSSAIAACGIVRTRDFEQWERMANLKTPSPQQRNVVLHPHFVNGKYGFYTRPQDDFIQTGKGGGIAFGVSDSIEAARIDREILVDPRKYHTISEFKNGLGPAPIKTHLGWLHLAHGVRNTASGLRYVLYSFVTDLQDLTKIIHKPAGYLMAPVSEEAWGDVSNVLFSNGWICDADGSIYIYYASSDTRLHVATTTVDQMLDYCIHTAPDGLRSAESVKTLQTIISKNLAIKKAI